MKFLDYLRISLQRIAVSRDLQDSFIYVAASTVGYGIVFLQNFSLAYFLSIEFFGQITLIISIFSTMYVLFTFGMNAVVQRFYFDKAFAQDRKLLLPHIATLWLLLGVSLCILLAIIGYQVVAVHSLIKLDYYKEFLPLLFGAFFFSFTEIFPNFYVVREKPLPYAMWLIGSRATVFIAVHIAIFVFGESAFHVSQLLLFGSLMLAVTGAVTFNVYRIVNLRRSHLRELFLYSVPLMIYALGGIGYSHGYRVIISNWLTYENLGIFTLTNQIALVYYLTAASCITGLYPKAYKTLEEHAGRPSAINFYFRILLYLGLGLMAVIGPLGYLFLRFFKDGGFEPGLKILPVLLASQFIFFLYSYNYILCSFYKKTQIITYSMLAGVATSLLTAYVLLPEFSLMGAAIPIVSGVVVQFIVSFALMRRAGTRKTEQTF